MNHSEDKNKSFCSSDKTMSSYFEEYYQLTGKEFPPCNKEKWESTEDWFADMKIAVYKARIAKEEAETPMKGYCTAILIPGAVSC
ncbi:MAG: hypothetical protein IJ091_10095 [Oscillospiraceae bacterium]|nr:hypothetical protein [Oscillospiraceae bacterium]